MTQTNDPKEEKGALRVDQSQLIFNEGFSFSGYERDPLYLSLGGKKFLDVSGVSGIDSITDGRAGVFADFDNDGDLDVFLTTIQGQSQLLFRNNVGQANSYLRVVLEGGADVGRDAYGAVVRVKTSAGVLTKIKSGGSGFLSQHDPRLLFGLGSDDCAHGVEVTWPNGKVERFETEAKAGSTLVLRQGAGRAQNLKVGRATLPDPLTGSAALARSLKFAIGKPIPYLKWKRIDGNEVSLLSELRPGRRTLINVWATWCAPCAREMPELEKLRRRLSAGGVDLVGLNVDTEPQVDVKQFVAGKKVRYPIRIGGVQAIEQLYATDTLLVPLSIIVDSRGVVTELLLGWSAETQKRLSELAGIDGRAPSVRRSATSRQR